MPVPMNLTRPAGFFALIAAAGALPAAGYA
jgi:hypothetical protein